jgi:hypothetical protein
MDMIGKGLFGNGRSARIDGPGIGLFEILSVRVVKTFLHLDKSY